MRAGKYPVRSLSPSALRNRRPSPAFQFPLPSTISLRGLARPFFPFLRPLCPLHRCRDDEPTKLSEENESVVCLTQRKLRALSLPAGEVLVPSAAYGPEATQTAQDCSLKLISPSLNTWHYPASGTRRGFALCFPPRKKPAA